MEQFLRVGVISSTHGIRGEVKIFPTTDDPRRFEVLKKVLLDTGKDVYAVETPQKKEILLPAIRECILDVNVEEKKMLVHVLEGLLDG